MLGTGNGPPTLPPFQKPTPAPPQDNSLFSLLLKIDKAIQDVDDKREYFRLFSDHERETPLELHCQVIEAQSFQQGQTMVNVNEATSPIALITGQSVSNLNTADFSYINQNECNEMGVRTAQEQLRLAVRRYHRAFLDLNQMRARYSNNDNNNVQSDAARALTDLLSTSRQDSAVAEGGLSRISILYKKIKGDIETGIHQFLAQITQIAADIVRLQRVAIARRMGWGYLLKNQNANFVVLVRHVNLLYGLANENLIQIPDSWIPFQYKKERTPRPELEKRSVTNETTLYFQNYLSPFKQNCVEKVSSLAEFSNLMQNNIKKTFQIIALTEADVVFNEKKEDLKTVFYMWYNTAWGWFSSNAHSTYYRNKIFVVERYFWAVLNKFCEPQFNDFDVKIKLLNDLKTTIANEMTLNLNWYYDTDDSAQKILHKITMINRLVEEARRGHP